MATLTLGDLLALIVIELDDALAQTVRPAALFRQHMGGVLFEPGAELRSLHVSELELDLPAHLQVQLEPHVPTGAARLMVTLPSTLEQPLAGRIGRLRLTIEPEKRFSFEQPLSEQA
jgi:hypothetical protein